VLVFPLDFEAAFWSRSASPRLTESPGDVISMDSTELGNLWTIGAPGFTNCFKA